MNHRGFVWGAATAAYQIEGAVGEGGRGSSIWDTFSHTPGNVERGETGDIACDHFHRTEEDVALLASLGVDAYRFSIAWPRVVPDGDGPVNEAGVEFYSNLVDALLARGITPVPTLYHWDLPQALEDRGGWRTRATAEAFARYAGVCVAALGDRVHRWATLNEPWCSSFLGHWTGRHAPGHTDIDEAFMSAHHLLLAHGLAVDMMRSVAPQGEYGIVLNTLPYEASAGVEMRAVAHAIARLDDVGTGLFFGGVLTGRYPEALLETSQSLVRSVQSGDMKKVSVPIDWLGVNFYHSTSVRPADRSGYLYPFVDGVTDDPSDDPTDMGWPVTPGGLTDFLVRLNRRFAPLPPVYITENGAAYDDPFGPDGTILDQRRIDYLRAHIDAVGVARAAGVEVRGYFVWSLLDNFEWSYGYRMRFGLVHVDFETLARTPRASFGWYRDRIRLGPP